MDQEQRGSAEGRQLAMATRGLMILALLMILILVVVQILLAQGYLL